MDFDESAGFRIEQRLLGAGTFGACRKATILRGPRSGLTYWHVCWCACVPWGNRLVGRATVCLERDQVGHVRRGHSLVRVLLARFYSIVHSRVRLCGRSSAVRECSVLKEVQHAHVVELLDVVIIRHRVHLVFELLAMNLRQLLELQPNRILPFETATVFEPFFLSFFLCLNCCCCCRCL